MSDRVEAQVLVLEMGEPFERPLDRSGVDEITGGDRRVHDLLHQSDSARIGQRAHQLQKIVREHEQRQWRPKLRRYCAFVSPKNPADKQEGRQAQGRGFEDAEVAPSPDPRSRLKIAGEEVPLPSYGKREQKSDGENYSGAKRGSINYAHSISRIAFAKTSKAG